jgi:hypothetical protein
MEPWQKQAQKVNKFHMKEATAEIRAKIIIPTTIFSNTG